MANPSPLLDFDVAALSQKLRAKEISPVELTQAYLDRIEAVDERIISYITVTAEAARAMARAAEKEITAGRWRGPFHGVPIGLKDLCYTKGILTTGGSKILGEFVPNRDSTVWTRLSEAGSICMNSLMAQAPTTRIGARAAIPTTSTAYPAVPAAAPVRRSSRVPRRRRSGPTPAAQSGFPRRAADASD